MDAQGPSMLIKNEEVRALWRRFCGKSETVSCDTFQAALKEQLSQETGMPALLDLAHAVSVIDQDQSGSIDVLELNEAFPPNATLSESVQGLCDAARSAGQMLPPRL